MSDGGLLPWKVQKIVSRGPPGDYSRLRVPLPNPPKGQAWFHNEKTGEWKLVASDDDQRSNVVTGGVPMRSLVQQEDGTCATTVVIDDMPGQDFDDDGEDDDEDELKEVDLVDQWEVLSESTPFSSGGVLVDFVSKDENSISSHTLVSYPRPTTTTASSFKRTTSNSTLDSNGCGILGVDYVEHVVLPTDTFQGICLAYRIHATRLRQVNRFSGSSLLLAPKKLIIPLSKAALERGSIRVQDQDSKEFKIHAFLSEFPHLTLNEAKAYIELADADLEAAIASAKEDGEWEEAQQIKNKHRSKMAANTRDGGQIRLTVNLSGNFHAAPGANSSSPQSLAPLQEGVISTKTVQPQDIHKMPPQDDSLGVEMQSLLPKDDNA